MQNNNDVLQHLIILVIDYFKIEKPEDITPTTKIRTIAQDSLNLVEFVMYLEDQYLVDIDEEDINMLITIQDIADYLSNLR